MNEIEQGLHFFVISVCMVPLCYKLLLFIYAFFVSKDISFNCISSLNFTMGTL